MISSGENSIVYNNVVPGRYSSVCSSVMKTDLNLENIFSICDWIFKISYISSPYQETKPANRICTVINWPVWIHPSSWHFYSSFIMMCFPMTTPYQQKSLMIIKKYCRLDKVCCYFLPTYHTLRHPTYLCLSVHNFLKGIMLYFE